MTKVSSLRTALACGACALTLGIAAPAFAQGYAPAQARYSVGPIETVTVNAPRFHKAPTRLNGPLEKVSLSVPVHYRTRDLLTPRGMKSIRRRVWRTSEEVCGRLAEAYPVYTSTSSPPCFRTAYDTAMARVDARVAGARLAYYGY